MARCATQVGSDWLAGPDRLVGAGRLVGNLAGAGRPSRSCTARCAIQVGSVRLAGPGRLVGNLVGAGRLPSN